jgi:hypothetical protein
MSHQFTYYALPEDFVAIESRLGELAPFAPLYDRSPTAIPRAASSLNFRDGSERWLFFYLVREVDLVSVITKYVDTQRYWTIECLPSPVVQCTGCFFDGKILRSGRMYYTDGDYDRGGTWVWKSDAFRQWAATVFRATKKCLVRKGRDYIGPAAAKWLETSGGKLVSF